MNRPTIEQLNEFFLYDEQTGVFTWKKSRPTNNAKVGNVAGYRTPKNYIILRLLGFKFFAHHAAFALKTGKWPNKKMEIDHVNRVPDDNRISNLRECSRGQNICNRKAQKNNKLGVKGVHIHKGKYCATIRINNKPYHIGYFNNLEDAKNAYQLKAIEIYGDFATF